MTINEKLHLSFEAAQKFNELLNKLGEELYCPDAYWYQSKLDAVRIVDINLYSRLAEFKKRPYSDVVVSAWKLDEVRDWFTDRGVIINVEYRMKGNYVCCLYFKDSTGHELGLYLMTFESEIINYPGYYDALSAGISEAIRLGVVM